MSVTKERNESYYAFNIDKKKGRLLNQKTLNFENLNKGFYDDIMNFDGKIRKEKTELGEKKENIEPSKSEIESQSIKIEEKKEEEKKEEEKKEEEKKANKRIKFIIERTFEI